MIGHVAQRGAHAAGAWRRGSRLPAPGGAHRATSAVLVRSVTIFSLLQRCHLRECLWAP
jgi:hypothetical protein